MRSATLPCLLLGFLLLIPPVPSQNVNMNRPEEVHTGQQVPSADAMMSRLNNVQLQKDAKELSDLCASIPPDMDGIKRGLLSKDVLDKLKRVEKLSRRLREELTR
jgi:hypothetical protein